MKRKDAILEEYGSLASEHFTTLEKLVVSQEDPLDGEDVLSRVSVMLSLLGGGPNYRTLHLSFYGVMDLNIRLPYGYNTLGFLDIQSIREYQWAHLHYWVKSAENDYLSFYCKQCSIQVE